MDLSLALCFQSCIPLEFVIRASNTLLCAIAYTVAEIGGSDYGMRRLCVYGRPCIFAQRCGHHFNCLPEAPKSTSPVTTCQMAFDFFVVVAIHRVLLLFAWNQVWGVVFKILFFQKSTQNWKVNNIEKLERNSCESNQNKSLSR